jgi:hypothetical protein
MFRRKNGVREFNFYSYLHAQKIYIKYQEKRPKFSQEIGEKHSDCKIDFWIIVLLWYDTILRTRTTFGRTFGKYLEKQQKRRVNFLFFDIFDRILFDFKVHFHKRILCRTIAYDTKHDAQRISSRWRGANPTILLKFATTYTASLEVGRSFFPIRRKCYRFQKPLGYSWRSKFSQSRRCNSGW